MIKILSHVHQFVPVVERERDVDVGNGITVSQPVSSLHSLLFGGDQLTVARVRGAQEAKSNSVSSSKRFDGLIPVLEDWHTEVILVEVNRCVKFVYVYVSVLQVIWKYFYDTNSAGEHCTLYQMRNLINHQNVGKVLKNCFNSCNDFLNTTITGHILSAALKTFGMRTLNSQPSGDVIPCPENVWAQTNDERKALLDKLSRSIVEKYINHFFNSTVSSSGDHVHDYTNYLMSIGCMYMLFRDAIREGDGERVFLYYRYLLPLFINAGRRNYANESLNLLCQYYFDLPPRMSQQLIWCRFINTAGVKGRNIPCDQHLEHLNRILKGTIHGLGANKSSEGFVRRSKALGVMNEILSRYDESNFVSSPSGVHNIPENKKELELIIKELQDHKVFEIIQGRKHPSFEQPVSVVHIKPVPDILTWVTHHLTSRYYTNKNKC